MGCAEKVIANGRVVYRDCGTGAAAAAPGDAVGDGPGTELKRLLKDWFGLTANMGCSCNKMARRMNANGPAWCEGPGMNEIVNAMRQEHYKRLANRQTILPWSDYGAKWLIRIACNRARSKAAG